jgi:CheY-like chemotaxis protein
MTDMPRPLRVLVVEDQEDAREALQLLLESWSCAVDTASDGAEALRLALHGHYDAVILDLNIPYIGGLEVGRAVAQKSPRPYLCAYSAFAGPIDRERTTIAGFDRHIAKGSPASITELEALVNQLRARL